MIPPHYHFGRTIPKFITSSRGGCEIPIKKEDIIPAVGVAETVGAVDLFCHERFLISNRGDVHIVSFWSYHIPKQYTIFQDS